MFPECTLSDKKTQLIKSSFLEVDCQECNDGYFVSYNIPLGKTECLICPKNTYSIGGSFRIKGSYYEWTNEILAQFQNKCFIKTKSQEFSNCSAMQSIKNNYIQTGSSFNPNLIDYTYVSQLSKTFTLVTPGHLKFVYKKDTINMGWGRIGIFSLYINYQNEINDSDMNIDFKEVSIPLQPGKYTFLWQYIKSVLLESKSMAMTIESITVTGLDSAARECTPCNSGISKAGSDHCSLCSDSQYFDKAKGQCVNCPEGTDSTVEECVQHQPCPTEDYNTIYSNKCNQQTHKMKISYEIINPLCKEDKLDDETECNECFPGQFISRLENNYYQCQYCPQKTSTEGNNFLNCKKCDGIYNKVMYYYPNNSYYFDNNAIETIDDNGHLHIVFNETAINNGWIETVIDSVVSKTVLTGNMSYNLTQGQHRIKITSKNSKIKYIKVTHTVNGGGYKCIISQSHENGELDNKEIVQCHPGFEYNLTTKECQQCSYNSFKETTDNTQCKTCPALTFANDKHVNCVPYHVANQNNQMMKISIGDFRKTQSKICILTGMLCNKDFYGPLRDKKKTMYYISFFSPNTFQSNDFTYKFKSEESKIPSFIYMLNSSTAHSESINIKLVSSIGKYIDYVKFIKGEVSSRGLLTHYINGDICDVDQSKTYDSYLFFNCTKLNEEEVPFILSPRLIRRNGCTFYFEWPSREACPICLRSEVSSVEMPCIQNNRKLIFLEGPNCIITNTTDLNGDSINYTNDSLMITTNDADLIKHYSLNDITNNKKKGKDLPKNFSNDNDETSEDYYIMENQMIKSCFLLSEINNLTKYIIISIPIVYVIIIIICVIICYKYRKIKGDYHMLVETPDTKNATSVEKDNPQLEIISSCQNEDSIEEHPKKQLEEHSIEVKIHHEQTKDKP